MIASTPRKLALLATIAFAAIALAVGSAAVTSAQTTDTASTQSSTATVSGAAPDPSSTTGATGTTPTTTVRSSTTPVATGSLTAAARATFPPMTKPLVGLGDQKRNLFGDPRFLALRINHLRFLVGWDALENGAWSRTVDGWMKAAHALGMSPLISFDHSVIVKRHRILPTVAQFRAEFVKFHRRYPWVTDYATWNEANFCGEVTCHHPERVAGYYLAMRAVCPSCHVLGAEVLDVPGMVQWVHQFIYAAGRQPAYWGLHNYLGANRLSDASTRAMLAAVRGDIWFTETAGLVSRRNHSSNAFPENAAHAARVTQYIFDHLAHLSSRIQRVYLYEWDAVTRRDSWDSALIGYDRKPRPAYGTLSGILIKLGDRPACELSLVPPFCALALIAGQGR